MKTLNRIMLVVGIIVLAPVFCLAATPPSVTCSIDYPNYLAHTGTINLGATLSNGTSSDSYTFTWSDGATIASDSATTDSETGYAHVSQTISNNYSAGTKTVTITATGTIDPTPVTGACSFNVYNDEDAPAITGSCSPSPRGSGAVTAGSGQPVIWTPSINGPFGPYVVTFEGTGTDHGFSSTGTGSYNIAGDQTAKMIAVLSRYGAATSINDATFSSTTDCTGFVGVLSAKQGAIPALDLTVSGSCSASSPSVHIGESVTWNSNLIISGGTAPYKINWTDSEGSIGTSSSTNPSISKIYSTSIGTKAAYLVVRDNASVQSRRIACGSISIIATSTDNGGGNNGGGNTGGGSNGGNTGGSTSGSGVVRNSTSTSPTQENIDNLKSWLRDNSALIAPLSQNTLANTLGNSLETISTTSASSSVIANGASDSETASSSVALTGSSTKTGISLAAAAASAAGSTAKYIWYIVIALLIAIISSWATLFFIRRKENKKDKIS